MSRAVVPSKADKSLYAWTAKKGWGGFELFFPASMAAMMSSMGIVPLIIYYGWLFAALYLPFVVFLVWGAFFYFNSLSADYSWDETLYTEAYSRYAKLTDPQVKADAKILLENIWAHEKAVGNPTRDHDSSRKCSTCYERVQLIEQLKEMQALPGTDGSDIDNIKMKMQVRKELGI